MKDPRTGHLVSSTDADRVKTEFDEAMKLLSVTRPDGRIVRFDPSGTPSRID